MELAEVRETSTHGTHRGATAALSVVITAAVVAIAAEVGRAGFVAVVASLVGHGFTVFAVHRASIATAGDTAAGCGDRFARREQGHKLLVRVRLHHQKDNQIPYACRGGGDGVNDRPDVLVLRTVSLIWSVTINRFVNTRADAGYGLHEWIVDHTSRQFVDHELLLGNLAVVDVVADLPGLNRDSCVSDEID